ncbi:MAG: TonB-dependent receptor [Phenylobacterium sp.]|nr:TonB-dependent receptor [Phenylobacterium sp.]
MLRSTTSWAVLAAALAAATSASAQSAGSVEELVVTGQRASQQKAIAAKRDATAVIDAISADELGRLADKNVAENLERLPGVGLFYDQGEGRYVSIRGIDASLNNVTLNGVQLGNPDGLASEPRVPLDVVGGQLLSRLEVVKVVTPDMDAQGIGGTVNLVTQSPFDFNQDVFARGSVQIGYQEAFKGSNPVQGDATIGGVFGDGRWGAMVGVSASTRNFRSAGFFPDDWRAVPGSARGGLPTTIKFTNYQIKRERLGVSGALEFRPGDDDKFYLRGLYSKFTEDEYRQRFRADFGSNLNNLTFNADGFTGVARNVDVRQDLRIEQKEKSFFSTSLGGEHTRDAWVFDYDLSYGYNEVVEPNQLWQFRSVTANTTVDFDMQPLLFTAEPRDLALSNLGFRQHQRQDEVGNETSYALRANARRDVDWGDGGYVKFGAKVRDEDKKFDGRTDVWDRAGAGPNRFTLADFDLHGPDQFLNFGDRTYVNRYVIDEAAMVAFTNANLSGPRFVQNVASSLNNATVNDYGMNQRIYAGYGMADVRFGDLRVIGGVRVERTEVDVNGFRLISTDRTIVAASDSSSYTDILPNLQFRFEPREDVVLRAAYSRTLGRPNFGQLKISGTLTFTPVAGGLFEGELSAGNVDLKPYVSDNFDATAEWYFAPGGLISVGAFHKRISDPIYGFEETLTNITLEGRTYSRLEFSQPRNADKGQITGVEFAFQQQFTFLPGFWRGFGVAANLTLVDSQVDTFDRRTTFPQQSDVLYGGQIFYQQGPVEAALSYHHTGKNLASLGSTAALDTTNDDYERLDAKGSYAINERVDVFAEVQNITDTKLRQYNGPRRDWITNYERLRRTFYVGVSARW